MSEDENAEAARSLDPRTAEVLRFLDRAKGTIAKTRPNLTIEATAESLDSTARVLERVAAVAGERLADFQRGQDRAVRRASRLSRPAHTSGGCPGRMARLVDEAGGYLGCGARAGPCRRDCIRLAGPRGSAEHPRHPAADPREPDQGSSRQSQ